MAKGYTKSFRSRVVQEVRKAGNAALVARRHHLPERVVQRWAQKAFLTKSVASREAVTMAALAATRDENRRLKELLGDRDLEIAGLKDYLKRTLTPRHPLCHGPYRDDADGIVQVKCAYWRACPRLNRGGA